MSEAIYKKNISKREFLKLCGAGFCGLMIEMNSLKLFTKTSSNYTQTKAKFLNKWSREALFYSKTNDGLLQCEKCPHECKLADGDLGFCRNRINVNDKLYTIAYGNPCAVHIDPIEKKPFFHFMPSAKAYSIAIAGCNFRCLNCQNWQISQVSPKETDNYDLMPEKAVEQCLQKKCETIAYTYSEPITFYEYVYDTSKLAKSSGIKNLLKSNGYINEKPLRQLCKVIDAANIDLKVFDDEVYKKISSGRLNPILRNLKIFREEGVWLEITNLVIPSWTDNLDTIKRMCEWLVNNKLGDVPIHFSRFIPLYKLAYLPYTPLDTLEKARKIGIECGMKYIYIGNVPANEAENTYCYNCKKMLIQRRGYTILQNHIKEGKCKFCGEKIDGVWN